MLRLAPSANTAQQRLQLFREAETILMEQVPIIPNYTYNNKHLVHASVSGLPPSAPDQRNFRCGSLESTNGGSGED